MPRSRLSDADLLTELLGGSGRHRACAQRLLAQFANLRALCRATPETIASIAPCGAAAHARLAAARELMLRQFEESLLRGQPLTSPSDTLDYLRSALRDRSREVFCCLFLDTRHRVLASEDLFLGSIDGACVYPRVVAEKALRHGAAAVIVAHNHPSGVTEPSLADQAITRRLKDALALLEIRLLDHFVIGDGEPVSLASRGMV